MVTSPAQNATRVTHRQASRTQPPTTITGRTGLVVRLELPDVDADDQQPTSDHYRSDGSGASQAVDPQRVARAVEDLLRAIAPALGGRVRVEVAPPAGRPVVRELGQLNDLRLDLGGRTLSVDGRLVVLTRREFELLAYLQQRRGVALSRRELMDTVWQTGYLDGDRTIDVHVRRLRQKLGRHANRLSTLRGYGYRFD
jgi:Transcriptional regulatory protein, C terminal